MQEKAQRARATGKKPKYGTRAYHRCKRCGRVGGYIGFFEICRICLRELASKGEVMGVKKSSW
ncbi:MAG: type Z 30S ribosomal protein S14 [Candidatus Peregrinibacteria bacterium]